MCACACVHTCACVWVWLWVGGLREGGKVWLCRSGRHFSRPGWGGGGGERDGIVEVGIISPDQDGVGGGGGMVL